MSIGGCSTERERGREKISSFLSDRSRTNSFHDNYQCFSSTNRLQDFLRACCSSRSNDANPAAAKKWSHPSLCHAVSPSVGHKEPKRDSGQGRVQSLVTRNLTRPSDLDIRTAQHSTAADDHPRTSSRFDTRYHVLSPIAHPIDPRVASPERFFVKLPWL